MVMCTTAPTGAAGGQTVIEEPAREPAADAHPVPVGFVDAGEAVDGADVGVVATVLG
jgi:hypothetical protein